MTRTERHRRPRDRNRISTAVGIELVAREEFFHLGLGVGSEVCVLVELGLEALDLAEALDEGGAGFVTAQGGHALGSGREVL